MNHLFKFYHFLLLLIGALNFGSGLLAQSKVDTVQEVYALHLSEAIERALHQGWETRKAQQKVELAQANFARSRSNYFPQISLTETGVFTNSPLQAFGILLNQEIVEPTDFNPSALNNPDTRTNFNTQLTLQQAIFNPDALYQRKAAETQVRAQQLMEERVGKGSVFAVKEAYFRLQLAQESQNVVKKAIKAAQENKRLSQENFAQGYIQKADLMEAELRLFSLQNQLEDAENQFADASDQLAYLINLPLGSKVIALEALDDESTLGDIPSEKLSEQRSDFQAQRYVIQAREQILLSHKKRILPRLNAFAAFELNDNIPFGPGANNWMAGFQLKWDIFTGFDRVANTQKSKVALNQAQLEYEQNLAQSKVELEKRRRAAQLAKQKLVRTQRAVQQAQEALRIRRDRYAEGLEKTRDVLNTEALLAEKELEHLQTLYAFRIASFYLDFLLEN